MNQQVQVIGIDSNLNARKIIFLAWSGFHLRKKKFKVLVFFSLLATQRKMSTFDAEKMLAELDRLNEAYCNGAGELEDGEFDALVRYYEEKTGEVYERNGAAIPTYTNSSTVNEGNSKTNKVKLPYFMGSVDSKVKGNTAQKRLDLFAKKYPGPWLISLKIDGNAGQYNIKDGQPKMCSKGDGYLGQDISSILKDLKLPIPPVDCVIRGELALPKDKFEAYAKKEKATGNKNKLTSVRNAGSILLNREDGYDASLMKHLCYLTFQIQSEKMSPWDAYQLLEKYGFSTPEHWIEEKELIAEKLTEQLLEAEKNSRFEIDGFVITPAYTVHDFPVDSNPKHMIAFKVDTFDISTVKKVIWKPTPKGRLTPIVYYEPRMLYGGLCVKAKGHNAKFIFDHKIGPGSEVLICRAGKIIPSVVRGITPCEEFQLPEIDYTWDETETQFLIAGADENKDVQIARLVHFAKAMKIDDLQVGRVTALYEGGIDTIHKLITCTVEQIAGCERLGRKSALTIRKNIEEKISSANLVHVMVASNVFGIGFGETKIGAIIKAYPNILDYYDDEEEVVEMLEQLGGFRKMATVFAQKLPLFLEWLDDHPEIIIASQSEEEQQQECAQTLAGEVVVFTGFTNAKLAEQIVAAGGDYKKAVSGKTTILVAKDLQKLAGKANKLSSKGRIISLASFLEEYGLEM